MKKNELIIPFDFENRKPYFDDKMLFVPKNYFDHMKFMPKWDFENDYPINIEYCSGNGEWIIKKALDNPNLNWLAVEIKIERAKKIYKKIQNNFLKNLIIVLGPAQEFTKYYLKDKKINEIFINFPDPWPKKRHEKNRLLNDDFINDMLNILENEKFISIVSDDNNYINEIINNFSKNNNFKSFYENPYFRLNIENFGSSFFDNLWRKKNKAIKYLKFQKVL